MPPNRIKLPYGVDVFNNLLQNVLLLIYLGTHKVFIPKSRRCLVILCDIMVEEENP
jgi:hypothetical protein